jgi:hypothetical protein
MGTWSAEIFGNDTSCEVKEYFIERYNIGIDVTEIVSEINYRFSESIALDDDCDNVLLALSYCLWETQALSEDNLRQVTELIQSGKDIDVLKGLGADDKFLKSRETCLQKYLQKISVPRKAPLKRKKPATSLDTNYHNGGCLSFRYPDGHWGGAIIIECEFFKGNGGMSILLTDIHQPEAPSFSDFQHAHLSRFEWEEYHGKSKKYIAFDSMTARLTAYSFGYDYGKDRERFFEYNDKFFVAAGGFAPFEHYLLTTVGGFDKIREADYEQFAVQMQDMLYYYANKATSSSKETLSELESLLS